MERLPLVAAILMAYPAAILRREVLITTTRLRALQEGAVLVVGIVLTAATEEPFTASGVRRIASDLAKQFFQEIASVKLV